MSDNCDRPATFDDDDPRTGTRDKHPFPSFPNRKGFGVDEMLDVNHSRRYLARIARDFKHLKAILMQPGLHLDERHASCAKHYAHYDTPHVSLVGSKALRALRASPDSAGKVKEEDVDEDVDCARFIGWMQSLSASFAYTDLTLTPLFQTLRLADLWDLAAAPRFYSPSTLRPL
ncbi:hypothetical protein BDR04DRAFT_1230950 [Suillus decipiens]|nr:hypothetical protein BDR04DRAFT_1230950 [Suillus decipiens]